jgi:hypothetical protein
VTSCIVDSAAIYIMVVKFRNTICLPLPQLSLHRRAALSSNSNGTRSVYSIKNQKAVYIILWDVYGADPSKGIASWNTVKTKEGILFLRILVPSWKLPVPTLKDILYFDILFYQFQGRVISLYTVLFFEGIENSSKYWAFLASWFWNRVQIFKFQIL